MQKTNATPKHTKMAPIYLYGYLFPWKFEPRFHVLVSREIRAVRGKFSADLRWKALRKLAIECYVMSGVLLKWNYFPRINYCNETESVTNAC